MSERWATFDCYGTLVDWDGGIRATLGSLWPDRDAGELLDRYHDVEPKVQREGETLPYREVMARCVRRIAQDDGLPLAPDDEDALGRSLPTWPVFADVPEGLRELRAGGWRIGILSNTDPGLLDASLRAMGVPVDLRITAADAGSYKPAHGHWERFRERAGPDLDAHVHVAASPFHDLAPCAELGIPAVWINRLGEITNFPRVAELPTLEGLREVLDRVA